MKRSAAAAGRSISEEVERRIEAADERELRVGGPAGTKFLKLAAAAIAEVQEAVYETRGANWTESTYARIMVGAALQELLDGFGRVPEISDSAIKNSEAMAAEIDARAMVRDAGADIARRLVQKEALTGAFAVLEQLEATATGKRRERVRREKERLTSGIIQIARDAGEEDDET